MIKIISLCLFAVCTFTSVSGQIGIPCHASFFQFTPRHALNISRYIGDWYLHEIAGSDIGNFPEPTYRCSQRSLFMPEPTDELTLDAVDSFINIDDGVTVVENRQISVNDSRSPFTSVWTMVGDYEGEPLTSKVIIMAADLEFAEWTMVYSCAILPPDGYRYETVSAMTRSRDITPELRNYLKALMVGLGFRIGDHHPVDQTNCE